MQVTNIVNGVDLDRLFGTIEHISAEPTLARFQFRARNRWIVGGHNRTTIKVSMDAMRLALARRRFAG
ncbi:MAG: hypothetical protein ACXVV5_24240 [Solirubrobacteraceae bacterium]